MKHRKNTKNKAATSDTDPATLAERKALERQRKLMARALLQRRRRKSGQ